MNSSISEPIQNEPRVVKAEDPGRFSGNEVYIYGSHYPHPFGSQRSAWWFTVEVFDSSTSHASPTLVESGTITVHH